jgi:hypothetical protein
MNLQLQRHGIVGAKMEFEFYLLLFSQLLLKCAFSLPDGMAEIHETRLQGQFWNNDHQEV